MNSHTLRCLAAPAGVGHALVVRASVAAQVCVWQKRPAYMAKETCVYCKRDLCIWQKRPMYDMRILFARPSLPRCVCLCMHVSVCSCHM